MKMMMATEPSQRNPIHQRRLTIQKHKVIYDLLGKTNSDVKAFLKFYNVSKVEDMTVDVWTKATKALQGKLNKGEG